MEFKYNWHKYPDIVTLLLEIYFNTCTILEKKYDGKIIAEEYIHMTEEYLIYLSRHGFDLKIIHDKLKNLLYVKPETFKEDIPVINGDRCILLNENIEDTDKLDLKENQRLYLYKGLSRVLFNFNEKRIDEFSLVFEDENKNKDVVIRGFDLILDTLAEELAERATFETLGKKRPTTTIGYGEDEFPINDSLIASRLLHERAFDEILINFGLTISNVGNMFNYGHDKLMDDLLQNAINYDLSNLIISEYIYKGNGQELYNILYMMGLLVNARDHKNLLYLDKNFNKVYNSLLEECQKLVTFDDDYYEDVPIVNNITRLR